MEILLAKLTLGFPCNQKPVEACFLKLEEKLF